MPNKSLHHHSITKFLHWSVALLVFIQIPLGLYTVTLSNEDIRYYQCLDAHQLIGLALFALAFLTIIKRFFIPSPTKRAQISSAQNKAAQIMHRTLLVVLVLQPILGYLFVTAWGDPLELYSFIEIPHLTEFDKPTSERIIDFHAYLAYILILLVTMHITAALRHHYVHRNDLLSGMLPNKKNSASN